MSQTPTPPLVTPREALADCIRLIEGTLHHWHPDVTTVQRVLKDARSAHAALVHPTPPDAHVCSGCAGDRAYEKWVAQQATPPGEVEALRAEVERLRERLRAARRAALAGASQYDALAANARATDNDATAPMLQRAAERFRDVLDALDRPTPGDNRG